MLANVFILKNVWNLFNCFIALEVGGDASAAYGVADNTKKTKSSGGMLHFFQFEIIDNNLIIYWLCAQERLK